MAKIRIPASAIPLLPLCQTHTARNDRACFESYAALVTFAACYAYHLGRLRKALACKSFAKSPEPIDTAIFRSQGLYPQLLLLSLEARGNNEEAAKETNVVALAENLADFGCEKLTALLAKKGEASFAEELGLLMAKVPDQI